MQNHKIVLPETLLETEDRKQMVGDLMKRLILTPDWQVIDEVLKFNLERFDQLLYEGEFESKEEWERLRLLIKIYRNMRDMPNQIIKQTSESRGFVDFRKHSGDPYEDYLSDELTE